MSILTSLILVVAIFLVALFVSYQVQKGQLPMSSIFQNPKDEEETSKKSTENL